MNLHKVEISFHGKSPSTRELRKAEIRLTIRANGGKRGWEPLFDDQVRFLGEMHMRSFFSPVAEFQVEVTQLPGFEAMARRMRVELTGYHHTERIRVVPPVIHYWADEKEKVAL